MALRRLGEARTLALLVALGATAAACGGGDDDAEAGPSDAAVSDTGAGSEADAGAQTDGGTREDLGGGADAGSVWDGGGGDAGASLDGGADGGAPEDAGAAEDAGGGEDAGGARDVGGAQDAGESEDVGGGEADLGPVDPHDFDCVTNPGNRYCPLEDLRDQALLDALGELVEREHVSPVLWDDSKYAIFTDLELREEADGSLYALCIYTGEHHPLDGETLPNFDDFNIEHSWPKSLGADDEPAKGDLHHLFPVNSRANSYRSSYPFGETECVGGCRWEDEAGSALGAPVEGTAANGVEWVFEVRPEFRGDIARGLFYFAVRYPEESHGGSFPEWEQEVLRAWHAEDAVDPWELERNDGIEGYQGNRNPFVDRPNLVERIARF